MASGPKEAGAPRETLVQYDPPIELLRSDSQKLQQGAGAGGKRKVQIPSLDTKPSIQDILNAILPPREWDHEGKHYVQYVSHHESSRDDVANLQKLLDERLLARQARFLINLTFLDLSLGSPAFVLSVKSCIASASMKSSDK